MLAGDVSCSCTHRNISLLFRGNPFLFKRNSGFFDGVGTQLKRNFFPKYFAVVGAYCGLAYGLTYMYAAAGVLCFVWNALGVNHRFSLSLMCSFHL